MLNSIWDLVLDQLPTIVTTIVVIVPAIAAVAKWFLPKLLEHKFQKDLEAYKKDLAKELTVYKSSVDSYYNRELERHKHDLQKVVEDRKIVLSLLYQKRMEALIQINQALYGSIDLCQKYTLSVQMPTPDQPAVPQPSNLPEVYVNFTNLISTNSILFPTEICQQWEALKKLLMAMVGDYYLHRVHPDPKKLEKTINTFQTRLQKIYNKQQEIDNLLRTLMGNDLVAFVTQTPNVASPHPPLPIPVVGSSEDQGQ